jgi:hypothetical protein
MGAFRAHGADGLISRKRGGPSNRALGTVFRETVLFDPAGGTSAAEITEPYMAFGGGTVPAGTVVKAPTPAKPIQGIIAGGGTVYSFDPDAVGRLSVVCEAVPDPRRPA